MIETETVGETQTHTQTRRRSSADSRERLLQAAGELFSERGYDHTTVREVGLRAGVDPALIARYFGSKSALYLASLRRDGQPANIAPLDLRDARAVQRLLDRVSSHGPTPTLFAAIRPHEDHELQVAAMNLLGQRLLDPAERIAAGAGMDDARLRAEIAVAALAGIIVSRTSHAFETLTRAPSADVGRLVAELIQGLLEA